MNIVKVNDDDAAKNMKKNNNFESMNRNKEKDVTHG